MTKTPILKDSDLLELIREGRKDLYAILVERYWSLAVGLARLRVQDVQLAEDLAQESFVKAYQHLGSLRQPERFAGWFSRIVIQHAANYRREKKRFKLLTNKDLTLQLAPAQQSQDMTSEQIQQLSKEIGELPWDYQQIILMRFMSGMNLEEIGRQLQLKPVTVRVRLHRAYERLRKSLSRLPMEVII